MNSGSRKLDRQFRSLTASQRAGLLARYIRRGAAPDKAILSTMPNEDAADVDRRIRLICAAKQEAPYILLLEGRVAVLEVKFELVNTRRHFGADIRALGAYIRESTREPVTKSDYRRREQELRAELVPVRELVEIAIERHVHWNEADYSNDGGERGLSRDAWTRVSSDTEHELLELVRRGTLEGEDPDTGAHISAGSFYDWLGEPIPVLSESGCLYEVFPDRQAKEVASMQNVRRLVEELIMTAPGRGELPLELKDRCPDEASAEKTYAALERMEIILLRDGVRERWRELCCLEVVLAELAAEELNGEDPLSIDTRRVLADIRVRLIALHRQVQSYAGDFAVPKPAPEDLRTLRDLMTRSADRLRCAARVGV